MALDNATISNIIGICSIIAIVVFGLLLYSMKKRDKGEEDRRHLGAEFSRLEAKYESLNERRLEELTDSEAMLIWKRAFTHESYNVEPDENYETTEWLGDQFVGSAFCKYLYSVLPKNLITERNLTLFNNYYMSKNFQPQLARKLGLSDFVRLGKAAPIFQKIEEDIFESFFGALVDIADNKLGQGVGYVLTF